MIEDLLAGNERFCNDTSDHCQDRVDRRLAHLHVQRPSVAVLSCADARVDPDVIFDAGLGDVFSVRVAGTVATEEAIASLRYATDVLEVPTVIVLGHEGCGAVGAAETTDTPEWLEPVLGPIREALGDVEAGSVFDDGSPGARRTPVRRNTCWQAHRVRSALPTEVQVLAAVYDPETGRVAVVDTVAPAAHAAV